MVLSFLIGKYQHYWCPHLACMIALILLVEPLTVDDTHSSSSLASVEFSIEFSLL
jgi:hypothetical protein